MPRLYVTAVVVLTAWTLTKRIYRTERKRKDRFVIILK